MPEPGEDEARAVAGRSPRPVRGLPAAACTPRSHQAEPRSIHPEGDALYHSLQVFHLAREARPYDEEFLLAALLHDVGKAVDPQDHAAPESRRSAAP